MDLHLIGLYSIHIVPNKTNYCTFDGVFSFNYNNIVQATTHGVILLYGLTNYCLSWGVTSKLYYIGQQQILE